MSLDSIEAAISFEEKDVQRLVGEAKVVATELKTRSAEIVELDSNIESLNEAIGVLSSFADDRQATLQVKVEKLVTHGLVTIFGEDMSFHILQSTKGKLAAADFVIRSKIGDQVIETPVMDARGGGVAAVVGFLLRLILLLLRPHARPILMLDESFAQLSAEYELRLADFLRELVDKSPVQLILVTHSTAFDDVADISYRFDLKAGKTVVSLA